MGYWDLPDLVECEECGHPIEQHDLKGCQLPGGEFVAARIFRVDLMAGGAARSGTPRAAAMTGQPAFSPGDAVLVFYQDAEARGLYPGGFPGQVRKVYRKYGEVTFIMPRRDAARNRLVGQERSMGFELATGLQHPYHEGISEGFIVTRN